MAGLGAFVLTVKPRRPGNVAFAVFAVAWGLGVAPGNWYYLQANFGFLYVILPGIATGVAFLGLCAMMFAFPAPVGRSRLRWVWFAAGMTCVATLASFLVLLRDSGPGSLPGAVPEIPGPLVAVYGAAVAAVAFAVAAYLLVVAVLVRTTPRTDPLRHQYVVVTVALLLYAGYVAGGGIHRLTPVFPVTPWILVTSGVLLAAMLGLAVLWLRESATGPEPKTSRNVALLALALPLLGLVLSVTGGAFEVRGVLRTLCVVVLAYAMVRHQLLGIDVKVRWTISKSTVAAAFVAVFFLASEFAQKYFSDVFQKEYLGIGAAGLLVFGIAPLHRFADRLAEKAVPLQTQASAGRLEGAAPRASRSPREDMYQQALRIALVDRHVTREEELHLFRLAEELGIGAGRAMELRNEVESTKGAR